MPPVYRPKHTLQYSFRIQARSRLIDSGHRVHHIANDLRLLRLAAVLSYIVIQLLQHQLRLRVLVDLEELDADPSDRGVALSESTSSGDNHGLDVVGCLFVGNNDNVERLDVLLASDLQLAQIRAEDRVQTAVRESALLRSHAVEDGLDSDGSDDVSVLGSVGRVQEVDVDVVYSVSGADGDDDIERVADFASAAVGHAVGVVDQ